MKVKMLTNSASPKGVFLRGQIVDVSLAEAKDLVAAGFAEDYLGAFAELEKAKAELAGEERAEAPQAPESAEAKRKR